MIPKMLVTKHFRVMNHSHHCYFSDHPSESTYCTLNVRRCLVMAEVAYKIQVGERTFRLAI